MRTYSLHFPESKEDLLSLQESVVRYIEIRKRKSSVVDHAVYKVTEDHVELIRQKETKGNPKKPTNNIGSKIILLECLKYTHRGLESTFFSEEDEKKVTRFEYLEKPDKENSKYERRKRMLQKAGLWVKVTK